VSKQLNRQLINAFKAHFKDDNVVIPAAIRQEQSAIVFTGLVDPTERQMMNKDTPLDPAATAGLLALPGGEAGQPALPLPPGTMDQQAAPFPPMPSAGATMGAPTAPPQPSRAAQAPSPGRPAPQPEPAPSPNPRSLTDRLLLE
jgi:hypothetical protein